MKTLVAAVAVAAACVASPQSAEAQVAIEFLALSDKGEAIRDLRPADVTLKVAGRDRRVRSLELVTHAKDAGAAAPAAPSPVPPPYVVTGGAEAAAVRHVMLLLDETAIPFGQEQPIKDGVARLISTLSPRDRVGLVSLKSDGVQVGYTTDREAILKPIDTLVGGRGVQDACHTRVILETIKSVLATTPQGLGSSVFLISAGSAAPGVRGAGGGVGGCSIRPDEFTAVENAIDRSQTTVHTVHVGVSLAQGLNNLAGAIGAENVLLSFGDATAALARAVEATSAYYRATIDLDAGERGGPPQRVELRVNRQGTRVRAPRMVAPSGASGGAVGALVRSTSTVRDVPLRAAAFSSSHMGGKVKVVVLFEPVDPSVTLSSAVVALFDQQGELMAQSTLRPADLAGRPARTALPVTPGTYRLRVAATDASGRGGTVDDHIRAELTSAATVQTSGLLFGTRQHEGFVPRLEFTNETSGIAYLELYPTTAEPIDVVFELADTADGPARARLPASVQRGTEMSIASAEFAVAPIPAGDMVMRAVVGVGGKPVATVMRTLRKTAR